MKIFILFSLMFLTACVRGRTHEGEMTRYEHTGDVFGVPVIERKAKAVVIEGRVVMENQLLAVPAGLEARLLMAKDQVSQAKVKSDGSFQFLGTFREGNYSVRVSNSRYSGAANLLLNTDHVENFQLVLHKR